MSSAEAGVLVAGVGNIFLGDDGFGVEVARRLADYRLPSWVRVADYGISGIHLAYDLLAGYHTTILVDATTRGDAPGTVYVIELDPESAVTTGGSLDAHGMQPDLVFRLLDQLGGRPGRVLLVGCEPACLDERIGLSDPVLAAVGTAVDAVRNLLSDLEPPCGHPARTAAVPATPEV